MHCIFPRPTDIGWVVASENGGAGTTRDEGEFKGSISLGLLYWQKYEAREAIQAAEVRAAKAYNEVEEAREAITAAEIEREYAWFRLQWRLEGFPGR